MSEIIHSITYGGLTLCLVMLTALIMVIKSASLEEDFDERQKARKKLQLKANRVKVFD